VRIDIIQQLLEALLGLHIKAFGRWAWSSGMLLKALDGLVLVERT